MKSYFCENSSDDDSDQNSKNYGFKSNLSPPPNDHLNEFENSMYDMIKNSDFRSVRNSFQYKLKEDLKKVQSSSKIMVFAEKTASEEEYARLINDNLTKTYQKTTTFTEKKIDKETKHFPKKLKLKKKMEQYAYQSAYVTLKDRKQNFKIKLPCQLINPAKSEIGIVSQVELEKTNRTVTNQIKCKQWRKTQAVIDWFD